MPYEICHQVVSIKKKKHIAYNNLFIDLFSAYIAMLYPLIYKEKKVHFKFQEMARTMIA